MDVPFDPYRPDAGLDSETWSYLVSELKRRGKGRPRKRTPEQDAEAARQRRLTDDLLRDAQEGARRWERYGDR